MNNKIKNKLLIIASTSLMISGIIFLTISILESTKNTNYLCIALANINIANLFNIIRIQSNNKVKNQEKN